MGKQKYLLLSLVSRKRLTKEPYGRRILSLFYDQYPELAPQYANFYEPINKLVNTVDEALQFWEREEFLFRRRNSIVGCGNIGPDRMEVNCITFEYNWNAQIGWFKLFQELVGITEAYFGYVHVFTETEIEPSGAGSSVGAFTRGTYGVHLRKGIPNLGWAHYFGEEYVKEIHVDLLQQHGFEVQKLGEGYLFQITPNLADVINNYEYFNERRNLLKSLFRPDLFQKYERYG